MSDFKLIDSEEDLLNSDSGRKPFFQLFIFSIAIICLFKIVDHFARSTDLGNSLIFVTFWPVQISLISYYAVKLFTHGNGIASKSKVLKAVFISIFLSYSIIEISFQLFENNVSLETFIFDLMEKALLHSIVSLAVTNIIIEFKTSRNLASAIVILLSTILFCPIIVFTLLTVFKTYFSLLSEL